jgi:hypothetical protein
MTVEGALDNDLQVEITVARRGGQGSGPTDCSGQVTWQSSRMEGVFECPSVDGFTAEATDLHVEFHAGEYRLESPF